MFSDIKIRSYSAAGLAFLSFLALYFGEFYLKLFIFFVSAVLFFEWMRIISQTQWIIRGFLALFFATFVLFTDGYSALDLLFVIVGSIIISSFSAYFNAPPFWSCFGYIYILLSLCFLEYIRSLENGLLAILIIISTIIMTTLVVIFGEILPKLLALKYNDYWVLVSSYSMELTMTILGPISNIATKISYLFLRDNKEISLLVDPHDEIRGQINLHHEDGIVKKGDKDMLGGILDLPEVTVEDVMTHRKNILTIDCDTNHDDVLSLMLENPYTRVPIWKNDKDNFIGVLHIKDLLKKSISKEEFSISDILVEPWFVPETTSLKEQLSAFLEKKTHMALVVDEYGALMGLITLEDILEEIVGQITDEHDVEDEDILPEEAYMIKVDGDSSIRD